MKDMKNNKNRFREQGERLKKCLSYAQMKQKDLSDRLYQEYKTSVAPQFISDIVRGVKGLPAHHVDEMSEILHVRRDYLLLKSDYMTDEERINAICRTRSERDSLCFDLLASMGYRIEDLEPQPDGSYSSMHRPYSQITINKKIDDFSRDDTDEEILKKAHDSHPVRIFRIITPTGKRIQVTQADLLGIVKSIQSFAQFQIENQYQN